MATTTAQKPVDQEADVHLYEPDEESGKRATEPNPRGWVTNNAAGASFLTRRDPFECLIRFNEKPAQEVLDYVKEQGFRWNSDDQVWRRPIGYTTAAQDRQIGRRTFDEAVSMILEQKGEGRQPF